MKRTTTAGLVLALSLGALSLSGCTAAEPAEKADMSTVWGYVASADKAQLDVAANQNGVDELVVKRVLSPTDGFLVVHADMNGEPGERVGYLAVKRGESVDVNVPIRGLTTPKVIVALHADKGTPGTFDFDMMNAKMSPDRPFFVDGKELAKSVTVRDFGVKTGAGTASLEASAQPGAAGELVIAAATAPTDGWIVVHLDDDGEPGMRVGLAPVRSGTTSDVVVTLDPVKLTPNLLVALHADKGNPGLFDFDMEDKLNSPDQPFFIGTKEVAIKVPVQ